MNKNSSPLIRILMAARILQINATISAYNIKLKIKFLIL